MKKAINHSIRILLLFIVLICIYKLLDLMLVDDTKNESRLTFHDFYSVEDSDNIDTVIIGASHIMRGISSSDLSAKTGQNIFCLSTSGQDITGSYFCLLEAERYYDIKKVIFEVSLSVLSRKADNKDLDTITYRVSDYIKSDINRYKLLKARFEKPDYVKAFCPLIRSINPMEGIDIQHALYTLKVKTGSAYRDYTDENFTSMRYMGGGYITDSVERYFDQAMAENDNSGDLFATPDLFNDTEWLYMNKVIDECRNNNIDLDIIIMPFSNLYVAADPVSYTESVNCLFDFLNTRNVECIDFNLISRDQLILTDHSFRDMDHLNAEGGSAFTSFLAEFINHGSDGFDMYDSVSDRLDNEPGYYGCTYGPYTYTDLDGIKEPVITYNWTYLYKITPYSNVPVAEWTLSCVDKNNDEVIWQESYAQLPSIFYIPAYRYNKTYQLLAKDEKGETIGQSEFVIK